MHTHGCLSAEAHAHGYVHPLQLHTRPGAPLHGWHCTARRMHACMQINKELLDFLAAHAAPALHGTDEEWRLWDSTVRKFMMVEAEHLEKEEREVGGWLPRWLAAQPGLGAGHATCMLHASRW